jgi:dTDP-4-amino-4,6-dideoxygalactose transaminase
MWCIKKGYIYSLLNDYNKYKNFRVENSKLIIDIINNKKLNATYPKIPSNIDVAYNRFPILSKSITENKKLLMLLKNKNIEAGNYNWQSTIWDYLKFYNLIDYKSDDFPNSNFAKKNIINLPIWSNKIWNNF